MSPDVQLMAPMQILVSFLLAHLVGDFVLQRQSVVLGKRAGDWRAFLEHGGLHLGLLIGFWLAFGPVGVDLGSAIVAIFAIAIFHVLIDFAKSRLFHGDGLLGFTLDQFFHLVIIVLSAWSLAGFPDWPSEVLVVWRRHSFDVGLLLAFYLAVVFGCGALNKIMLPSLLHRGQQPTSEQDDVVHAGKFIGWLERFLLYSAFMAKAWIAFGLILAAKSVFHLAYTESDRKNAQYFVIGTLVSVSEVVTLGFAYEVIAEIT